MPNIQPQMGWLKNIDYFDAPRRRFLKQDKVVSLYFEVYVTVNASQ